MTEIVDFIKDLVQSEKAYESDGSIYFEVEKFANYGKLSHRKLEDMKEAVRITKDEGKRHSADFALWKSAKPAEPSWDSPWGPGRPGWHIECSCMSQSLLGSTIDIHGGGMDLIFPHHENEIAQSESRCGQIFVKYWMHSNMLEFGNQKMSKSLGNIITGRSFIQQYNGEILKYMILSSHYRSVIDFSEKQTHVAIGSLSKFYSALALAENICSKGSSLAPISDTLTKFCYDIYRSFHKKYGG